MERPADPVGLFSALFIETNARTCAARKALPIGFSDLVFGEGSSRIED